MQTENIDNPLPEHFKSAMTQDQWDILVGEDPTLKIFGSSNWQGGIASSVIFAENILEEETTADGDAKDSRPEWRELQKKCWDKYRSFGPINASVNSKADYTAGAGFDVYSSNQEINSFIRELWFSHHNQLFARIVGWMVRMQAEVELFLLLMIDEEGRIKVRVLEPSRIKGSPDDQNTGLVTHPTDATETLFYYYKDGDEIIPDINIAYNPDLEKLVKDEIDQDKLKTSKARKNRARFKKIGGYNRFVIHWKNLTGIMEYKRDTSSIAAILEALNLYWNAIKWQLDHKKAQTAYAIEYKFDDSAAGKMAWLLFKGMTDTEKAKAGYTSALTPGAKLFSAPGITVNIKNPNIQKMDGENRDIMNVAGAGARSPQDMFQGDSGNATHSALKSSRPPLEQEIENMQYKLKNFVKYVLLRGCFHIASQFGNLSESFKKPVVIREFANGKIKRSIEEIDVEPCELVEVNTPHVRFENDMRGKASAFLGNNHEGLISHGVSEKRAAKSMGINDMERERDEAFMEEMMYGKKTNEIPTNTNQEGA